MRIQAKSLLLSTPTKDLWLVWLFVTGHITFNTNETFHIVHNGLPKQKMSIWLRILWIQVIFNIHDNAMFVGCGCYDTPKRQQIVLFKIQSISFEDTIFSFCVDSFDQQHLRQKAVSQVKLLRFLFQKQSWKAEKFLYYIGLKNNFVIQTHLFWKWHDLSHITKLLQQVKSSYISTTCL